MVLLLSAAGCESDRSRCESFCEWVDECLSTEDVSCTDDELDECADDVDDLSDGCDDAFSSFVNCLDDNDDGCSDVAANCRGEATEFAEQCDGELD